MTGHVCIRVTFTETLFHEKEGGEKEEKEWKIVGSGKLACSSADLRYVTPRIALREQITFGVFFYFVVGSFVVSYV